ncbi:Presenilins-associated rhomboid-like protein [Phytophthora citrophthora]|uniref:Presenilins-associated rhomboid-like protein n=1 Tax=Phytophthora citrophthora TaxID=4793 RepID=A0AAD9LLE5_9STRA|nr:Presenilins-associated rhomboid-like protein [Phytophthora citrophthora]
MLRVAGLRSSRASCFRSDVLLRSSHANTLTVRGSELRVAARQQQQNTLLINRASRHDRVLTASLGLVSGGIVVTSVLNKHDDEEGFQGIIRNFYGDANDLFYRGNGRQFDEPWYENKNKKAVASLIAANTLVFGLWRVSFRNAKMHQFMWRHFASSYDAVVYGKRFHTLLTSAFSHITFPHFGINMFMLWEFGPHVLSPSNNSSGAWYNRAVANSRFAGYVKDNYYSFSRGPELLSIERFMALYFTSAMTSSALSALVSKFRGNGGVFSIGASGAVSAVFTMSCLLFPDQRLLLYGIFDMTSAQMLQLYTALNIVGAAFQRNLRVDCVGHLGGQGAGFAYHQVSSSQN